MSLQYICNIFSVSLFHFHLLCLPVFLSICLLFQQDALFIRELAEIASSKSKKTNSLKAVTKSNQSNESNLDSLFADLEKQEEAALSSQVAASKGLFASSQWKKGFLSSSSSSSPKKTKKTTVEPRQTAAPLVRAEGVSSTSAGVNESPVPQASHGDITQQNTLLNRTTPTSAQNYIDISRGSGGSSGQKATAGRQEGGGSESGETTSAPAPVVPKKVSRFKQNRAASSSSNSSASSLSLSSPPSATGNTVPFTGQVVEK